LAADLDYARMPAGSAERIDEKLSEIKPAR
jgi:hypothetical protein